MQGTLRRVPNEKKMKNFLVLLLLILNIQFGYSQFVSGTIMNENDNPVEFANIVLLNSSDSTLIKGTISDESGKFFLDTSVSGNKLLRISYLGYRTLWRTIDEKNNSIDLEKLVLELDNQLNEVVIKASVAPFSRKGGNLIINVENTLLSSAGTANDVIKQIPGVTNDSENKLTVFGKGSPIIYIDNRRLYDAKELQQLLSGEIASMELITNPGAKYNADNNAVLLIRKKRKESGWALYASEILTQGNYLSPTENIGWSYNRGNISFFGSFEHEYNKDKGKNGIEYTINSDTLWKQLMNVPIIRQNNSFSLTSGMDWTINTKNAVGFQYKGAFPKYKLQSTTFQNIYANDIIYDEITSDLYLNEKSEQHLLNVFYIANYNEKLTMRLDMDYMNKHTDNKQSVKELSTEENRNINLFDQSDNNLYAGKVSFDYVLTDKSRLEFGGEYSLIEASGSLLNPQGYISDNLYNNTEEKIAGFAGYQNVVKETNIQLGIRYEYAHFATENREIDRRYHAFYPNLSLYRAVGNTRMSLAFSRKTQRPPFSYLSGSNYYINRFLQEKSNPNLLNESNYQIDYAISFKNLDFSLGYIYKKNPFEYTLGVESDNASHFYLMPINFSKSQEINAQISTFFDYKFWRPKLTLGAQQPFFSAYYLGEKQDINRLWGFIQSSNDFVLPKDYIFSVNFLYQGKTNSFLYEYAEQKTLNLELRKSFLNEKLFVQLQADDIFQWRKQHKTIMKVNEVSYIADRSWKSNIVQLTVRYHFNNYRKKFRGKVVSEEDINRL